MVLLGKDLRPATILLIEYARRCVLRKTANSACLEAGAYIRISRGLELDFA
jgi:hypothetical protein